MSSTMRTFTMDIESRLDKVYKAGAQKKFGFNDIVNESQKGGESSRKSTDEQLISRMEDSAS